MDCTCAAESSAAVGGGLEEFEDEFVPAQELRPAKTVAATKKNKNAARHEAKYCFLTAGDFFTQLFLDSAKSSVTSGRNEMFVSHTLQRLKAYAVVTRHLGSFQATEQI